MTPLEKSLLKGLGTSGMVILGFLAIMVIQDHTAIASLSAQNTQWQTDYGTKIDDIESSLHSWHEMGMADSTNEIIQK